MKKIFITTLLILLFSSTMAFSTITPQTLFEKKLTVQYRANNWLISTTFVKVKPQENFGVIMTRENGLWDREKPTKQNPIGTFWLYNTDLKTVQPYLDEFERTLKKDFEVVPNEIQITIGIWVGSEEIIIYFGDLTGDKEFYQYLFEKMEKSRINRLYDVK